MDKLKKFIPDWLNKYKYVFLIVVIGIALMLLPGSKTSAESSENETAQSVQTESLESKIEKILSSVHGAGEVNVLLTVSEGERVLYQENEDMQTNESSHSQRKDTVVISNAQHNETGLVQQINPPQYLGAVIVCQGADDPTVRLAIMDAVSKATGLRTDKISVLKMK